MPRALRYYVEKTDDNAISNDEWTQIAATQHWYNSEFFWSCDRIDFKRYILFPNYEHLPEMPYRVARFHFRKRLLAKKRELGNWVSAVAALEYEGLFSVRWGGTRDDSIASGITHVADNEFNAYLLCEFLLKCSTVATGATFVVEDEGRFVLPGRASFRSGRILVNRSDFEAADIRTIDGEIPQIFAAVDPEKYDDHPTFTQRIEDHEELDDAELAAAIGQTNGLGFGENYDTQWGDDEGISLQDRAREIIVRSH